MATNYNLKTVEGFMAASEDLTAVLVAKAEEWFASLPQDQQVTARAFLLADGVLMAGVSEKLLPSHS